MKKVLIASDHAGFEIKKALIESNKSIPWLDLGAFSTASVDYPDYADQLCQRLITETKISLSSGQSSGQSTDLSSQKTDEKMELFGVLICGSGQGMAIKANRYPEIRAALAFNAEVTGLSREHNNANVLVLPGRYITPQQALDFFKIFAETKFAGGRHSARVAKLSKT